MRRLALLVTVAAAMFVVLGVAPKPPASPAEYCAAPASFGLEDANACAPIGNVHNYDNCRPAAVVFNPNNYWICTNPYIGTHYHPQWY